MNQSSFQSLTHPLTHPKETLAQLHRNLGLIKSNIHPAFSIQCFSSMYHALLGAAEFKSGVEAFGQALLNPLEAVSLSSEDKSPEWLAGYEYAASIAQSVIRLAAEATGK